MVEPRVTSSSTHRGTAASAGATAALLLPSSPQSSIDVAVEKQRDDAAIPPSEATAASDRTGEEGEDGGGDDADADKVALTLATAAAADELAAVESHSLTQGAMKLVYLLAIQVGNDSGRKFWGRGGGGP